MVLFEAIVLRERAPFICKAVRNFSGDSSAGALAERGRFISIYAVT